MSNSCSVERPQRDEPASPLPPYLQDLDEPDPDEAASDPAGEAAPDAGSQADEFEDVDEPDDIADDEERSLQEDAAGEPAAPPGASPPPERR